ncbi:dioxygenase family protein [Marinobacterium arenosum]|uniref:dioxygenase family protein n=1 Tax=Marinobacterium arenosum TaxID=2862496 RepID=UPI001C98A2A9|nr:class III extradiol ring-cleavage dioxygenase [Marinobacterium arenosum]MBY4676689.1 dioxygenase [Marinobacterium arenosum]
MTMAPLFFISHGAPTFALEPGLLGGKLAAIGRQLPTMNAVLVVSPHWQTDEFRVMACAKPETIHDFGGFPEALYQLQYPAPGAPQYATAAAKLLAKAGYSVSLDDFRGLDHGAWVPLRHLLPAARVPVFQLSMPHTLDTAGALHLGQVLAPLRKQGVMILCSGSLTHNLYEFRQGGAQAPYAREFAQWVHHAVLAEEIGRLVDYRTLAPHAERAHPTEEHLLPLLVALGARSADEGAQIIEGGITYGVLSMDSYAWGVPAEIDMATD